MLTREQNLHNQETLYNLLAKHFCYDKKTLATLKDEIENRTVDPIYKNLGLDEFGRKYCPIEGYGSEKSDESWGNFKNIFHDFVSTHKVTYQNYLDNRIIVEKNNYRLIKAMSTYYAGVKTPTANMLKKSSEIRWNFNNGYTLGDAVLITLNKILEKRKSRKIVQAVISVNPVDIFLCSTANSWSTCYSCENSMMTYIGIPGLFFDFNRSIVFITDGNESTYLGLYKDKSLCRAWAMLDDKNYVNVEGFYPWGAYEKLNFAKVFNYDYIRSTTGDHRRAYTAKHRIETYLPHNLAKDTKIVYYPHLDYNRMTYDKLTDSFKIGGGYGETNSYKVVDGKLVNLPNGVRFRKPGSLSDLHKKNVSLKHFYFSNRCSKCAEGTTGTSRKDIQGRIYCLPCYKVIEKETPDLLAPSSK